MAWTAERRRPVLRAPWPLLGLGYILLQRGGGSKPRALPKLCKECLDEPLEQDYFGGVFGGEPPRLRQPTPEAFEEAAKSGRVLLIENASAGAAMAGWSCGRLAEEFPGARMRREYDWVRNPDDQNLQRLGDASWAEVTESGENAKESSQQDPKVPPFAPFYWGVREYRQGQVGSKKVIRRIQDLIAESVPRFMDRKNAKSMFDNAEFWLGARGTGARAHMDSHCISTLSVVLRGERRWRIGPVPRMPRGAGRSKFDSVVFDDGIAYKLGWKPMYEFTAREGEAVLFPPGWIHETLNTADGCTVALTTQFEIPRPVRYYRSYYSRLRRIGDLHPCWADMTRWGSLEGSQQGASEKPLDLRTRAGQLYDSKNATLSPELRDFYDVDGDGLVTRAEFVDTFVAWAATEAAVKRERAVRMPRPDMSLGDPSAADSARGGSEL